MKGKYLFYGLSVICLFLAIGFYGSFELSGSASIWKIAGCMAGTVFFIACAKNLETKK